MSFFSISWNKVALFCNFKEQTIKFLARKENTSFGITTKKLLPTLFAKSVVIVLINSITMYLIQLHWENKIQIGMVCLPCLIPIPIWGLSSLINAYIEKWTYIYSNEFQPKIQILKVIRISENFQNELIPRIKIMCSIFAVAKTND